MKTRQEFMKRYGALAKDLRTNVADKAALPQVGTSADEIATKSAQIPTLVPDGSQGGDALPAVWQNKADFSAKAQRLGELARALSVAAKSGDQPATQQAFGAMGQQGCGGCHETYRVKKS